MKKVYKITVKQLSAMHINGGTAADGKRITVKYDRKSYIPATLLKGVFRGNFAMLASTLGIDKKICGEFFGDGGFQRSRIILDNLFTEQETVTETRTNVSISRYTRKSANEMLVTSEIQSPFDVERNPVQYSGEMTVYYSEENLKYEKLLFKALQMTNAVGSGKSRGLGFVEVTVD